jgi:hypothetical protein
MPQSHGRKRYSPPAPRAPRIPKGERVVRQGQWFTTDHPQARWYRVVEAGVVGAAQVLVADEPDEAAAVAATVELQADGRLVLPASLRGDPEAVRVLGTALKAYRRQA